MVTFISNFINTVIITGEKATVGDEMPNCSSQLRTSVYKQLLALASLATQDYTDIVV